MAANVGRNLLVKKGGTVIAGIRSKSISINGSPIDITTDDDLGYRTLLEEAGEKSIDISFDGIVKDATLRDIVLGGTTSQYLTDITVEYPIRSGETTADTIAGDFFLTNVDETGTYNDSITFSAALQSSGQWTYTKGA